MTRRLALAALLIAAAPPGASATEAPEDDASRIPVRVEVTAADGLRGELLRCLQDVLGAHPAVHLDSADAALTLAVIATEQTMADGEIIGYLVYAGGYQPAPACSKSPPGSGLNAVLIQWQVLRMTPPEIKTACRGIVSDFSASVIEPTRRERERIRRQLAPVKRGS